ncbi:hypothetical protein SDRG_11648 [Saprolegnia diclina VS20]|uniref:Uncharacterized protein n=1 Tax=Saprolegnia diclina (strain VS20) TaxID=1156394 RepID=T0RE83_SAPDV|nr:hypothetical protein SDRG_11648 [Saprolegnia diclina VS20]EQC30593.1 hypothetical protein SDRG_11648 [Saprolegnia diclina VS20]|eukprot:XP_008615919.1 hypothetical protein SDRG_11648 [Saprolegnia diclina VS20]
MWMQQSMEGGRNHQQGGGGYGGSSSSSFGRPKQDDADWKSRIVGSGQWLGEKVMSLATGSSTNDNNSGMRSYNDGRANWMAEIRSNTGSNQGYNGGGYNGGGGYNAGGYQNDFATERPGSYADSRPYSSNHNSSNSTAPYSDSNYRSQMQSYSYDNKSSSSKKKSSNNKKHRKKAKESSSSDDSSDDSSASSDASSASSSDAKVKSKKPALKKKPSKRVEVVVSDGESTESAPETKSSKKTKAKRASVKSKASSSNNYAYSLDTSKVAAAASEEPIKGKKAGKKNKKTDAAPVVDLLGVESLSISSAPSSTAFAPAAPASTIDQLAGLSFDMPAQPIEPSFLGHQQPLTGHQQALMGHQPLMGQHQQPYAGQQPSQPLVGHYAQPQQQQQQQPPVKTSGFVVPGSDLVDLRTESEVSKAKVASDPRSLNELQKMNHNPPPQPVMPPPQPTTSMHPGMLQPHMMQLQPPTGMYMQPSMYGGYPPQQHDQQRHMMLLMQQQQQQQQQHPTHMTPSQPGFF